MPDLEAELRRILAEIVGSNAARKIIVAGPGTGKTTLFRRLLEAREGPRDGRLVLTFINNLRAELEEALGERARVLTFHGYCRRLLHRSAELRAGLTEDFRYYPPLPSLIEADWAAARGRPVPKFVGLMRRREPGAATTFSLERGSYYDSVSFDDSVFRVEGALEAHPDEIETFETVLIDEYQDFNAVEAALLDRLATRSPIVIAGDDDQALYSLLRSSSPEFIRGRYGSGAYARFALPFCMRCPEVIVRAVGDIVERARAAGRLGGRIEKPYEPYPPRKGRDSARYPRIKVVQTSVQSLKANYFGRYIAQEIDAIAAEEVAEAHEGGFPTVLAIGPGQYLLQVRRHLEAHGYQCGTPGASEPVAVRREEGLAILHAEPDANLGWRILLKTDDPPFHAEVIRASVANRRPLIELVPPEYRDRILAEAAVYEELPAAPPPAQAVDPARATIRFASFEGSKGLSGQHVFVVGLHEGDLPRRAVAADDLEVCKMIVAITRTRKQCHLLYTRRWSNQAKRPSPFVAWIRPERREFVNVTKEYW
jgi:hypothetical protein